VCAERPKTGRKSITFHSFREGMESLVTLESVHQMRFLVIYLYIFTKTHQTHQTYHGVTEDGDTVVTLVLTIKVLHSTF
jgi:hypothetical protein